MTTADGIPDRGVSPFGRRMYGFPQQVSVRLVFRGAVPTMTDRDEDLEMSADRPPRPFGSRKPSSGFWPLVLIVLALAFGGGVVVCCGGAVYFGLNMLSAEIELELRDNPRLREHVGEVQEFQMNLTRSLATADDDVYLYSVRGTKGSGELTVKHITGDDGNEIILEASLRLTDGTTVDLLADGE